MGIFFIVSSLLTIGLSDCLLRQLQAQVQWKPLITPQEQSSPVIWKTNTSESEKDSESYEQWEVITELEGKNQEPLGVVWEVLETEEETSVSPIQKSSNSVVTPPSSFEEAKAFLRVIPLKPSD